MGEYLLISDAAKQVKVESHVLRYWEEELHLPIKRNELGHRYYTKEDVERFKEIKSMKERGLQLKAIKLILRDGKLDVLTNENSTVEHTHPTCYDEVHSKEQCSDKQNPTEPRMAIEIVDSRSEQQEKESVCVVPERTVPEKVMESREDKAKRLQWLLQQLIREAVRENNQELCRELKESMVKELDYQFRSREEWEEERDRKLEQRNEAYYQKMDELLRKKTRGELRRQQKSDKKSKDTKEVRKTDRGNDLKDERNSREQKLNEQEKTQRGAEAGQKQIQKTEENNKKKRHFIF